MCQNFNLNIQSPSSTSSQIQDWLVSSPVLWSEKLLHINYFNVELPLHNSYPHKLENTFMVQKQMNPRWLVTTNSAQTLNTHILSKLHTCTNCLLFINSGWYSHIFLKVALWTDQVSYKFHGIVCAKVYL